MKIAITEIRSSQRAIIASVLAGILIGIGAHILKMLVKYVSLACTHGFNYLGGNYSLLVIPVGGIVLTAILVRYLFRHPLEHATMRIKNLIKHGDPTISPVITVAPIVASSVTLGCGGSAGSEGPIAFAGAAIGSNVARLFRLSPQQTMMLLACGAGAGIAAIFKAPVGGMLFTIEVLSMTLTTSAVLQLLLMCLTSSLTCFALSGFTPDLSFISPAPFRWAEMLPTAILGVACGIYSAYYLTTGNATRRLLDRLGNHWIRNLVSGAILAIALFCFPALYGEGYGLMQKVVNGNYSAVLNGMAFTIDRNILCALAGILLTKGIACYATNSGGGVAGDFAPTLFAGCMTGAMFALAANDITSMQLPVGNFALIGMAGVMSGAVRAPFMAIFLTVEMSFTPELLLPVAVCSLISYYTSLTIVKG